jgi:hypothetical protein
MHLRTELRLYWRRVLTDISCDFRPSMVLDAYFVIKKHARLAAKWLTQSIDDLIVETIVREGGVAALILNILSAVIETNAVVPQVVSNIANMVASISVHSSIRPQVYSESVVRQCT